MTIKAPSGGIVTSPRSQQPVDIPMVCYYANDPTHRPACTLTATVRLGAVALCASCNTTRSTLGRGQTPVPLPTGPTVDVLGWVATAHQQTRAAEATLAAAVTRARQSGATWSAIGAQLGLSRQGVQQRFTRASDSRLNQADHPHRHDPPKGPFSVGNKGSIFTRH
jgi:hypothetical protein